MGDYEAESTSHGDVEVESFGLGFVYLDPPIAIDSVPPINLNLYPRDEWREISFLSNTLTSLRGFVHSYSCAQGLFSLLRREYEAQPSDLVLQWQFVACRDAVMTAFSFGKTLDAIAPILKDAPHLRGRVDAELLREARKYFRDAFKGIAKVRHSVAHMGETSSTRRELDRHAMMNSEFAPSPGMSVHVTNFIDGELYRNTFEGGQVELEVSVRSAVTMKDITRTAFSAFKRC